MPIGAVFGRIVGKTAAKASAKAAARAAARAAATAGRTALRRASNNFITNKADYYAGKVSLLEASTGGDLKTLVAEAAAIGITIEVISAEKNGTIEDEIKQGAAAGALVGAVRGGSRAGIPGAIAGAIAGAVAGAIEGAVAGIAKEGGVVFGEESTSEEEASTDGQTPSKGSSSANDLEIVQTPESSVISQISYSRSQSQLEVQFKAGGTYTYTISEETWNAFKKAPSKGSFFSQNIRNK